MKITKEVKTFITRLYCDNCNCEMISTGKILTSFPLRFEYKCPNCNIVTTETENYPLTIYKEIE